jgi:hypothetical protein
MAYVNIKTHHAPVAQLDRVPVSETGGHRFDSCQAHQSNASLLHHKYNSDVAL